MSDPTPTLTDKQRTHLDTALRRCRVEDGSPAPLLDDWDRYHVLSMIAPVGAGMVAEAWDEGYKAGAADGLAAQLVASERPPPRRRPCLT